MMPTIRRSILPLVGLILMGLLIVAPAGASLTCSGLVGYPNYSCPYNLTYTLGPLLDGIAALMPSIINLIVALTPLFLIMAGLGLVFVLIYVIIEIVEGLAHSFKGKWGKR